MEHPSLILLVEDDVILGELIRKSLERQFPRNLTQIIWAKSFHDANTVLLYNIPDMIFLDLRLPDSSEQETLSKMLSMVESTPIIVLSGYYSSMEGLAAISSGAEDFVLKNSECIREIQIAASKAWARSLNRAGKLGAKPSYA